MHSFFETQCTIFRIIRLISDIQKNFGYPEKTFISDIQFNVFGHIK